MQGNLLKTKGIQLKMVGSGLGPSLGPGLGQVWGQVCLGLTKKKQHQKTKQNKDKLKEKQIYSSSAVWTKVQIVQYVVNFVITYAHFCSRIEGGGTLWESFPAYRGKISINTKTFIT